MHCAPFVLSIIAFCSWFVCFFYFICCFFRFVMHFVYWIINGSLIFFFFVLQFYFRVLWLLYWFIGMLASIGWCNHCYGYFDAFDMFAGSRCNGTLAYGWILWKGALAIKCYSHDEQTNFIPLFVRKTIGKGRRRRILSSMEQHFATKDTYLIRLVICFGLGWSCIQFSCCYIVIWRSCLLARRTWKRRTIKLTIFDARYGCN